MPVSREDRVRLIKNRRGFTLIEALIVISIIGVMSTLALPAVERMLLSSKADRAALVLSAHIQQAFTLAARQRKPVKLSFLNNPPRLVISDRATNQQMVLQHFQDDPTLPFRIRWWYATTPEITVYPNGLASSGDTIDLGIRGNNRRITMTRAGQVRISVP